jgi:hypothetical protein
MINAHFYHLYVRVTALTKQRQATDDNITRCMRFAYWITKATDTH